MLNCKWELSGSPMLHCGVLMQAAPDSVWSWLRLTGLQGLPVKGLPVVWRALKSHCGMSPVRGELLRSSKVCQTRRELQLSPVGDSQ